MKLIRELFDKLFRTRDGLYLVFGGLTTLVSLLVFAAADFLFGKELVDVSTVLKNVAGILFAYFTNRAFVFKSKNSATKAKITEFAQFIVSRLVMLALDLLMTDAMVDNLGWHTMVAAAISTCAVIILNYFVSRFFVFRKKKGKDENNNT